MTLVDRPSMTRADLLITGGLVVTMDDRRRVIEDGAVAIADGRIQLVGPASEVARSVSATRTIDATRKVVLPGFIDAHAHAGHSLTKGIGAHLPTNEWATLLDDVYFRATTPEYWYFDGLLSGLERLRFGTTTAAMMLGSQPRTDHPDYARSFARGSTRSGARTLISIGPPAPPWPKRFVEWRNGTPKEIEVTYERCVAVTEELLQDWTAATPQSVRAMVGPPRFSVPSRHDLFFNTAHMQYGRREADDTRRLADRYGVRIHTHAYGETVAYLHEHYPHLLGDDVLLVHCTGISAAEVEILARSDVKVAHCPTARRPYMGPRCPVPELMEAGVTVAVASDASAPDRSFDLFETMRTAQKLQRVHFADPAYLPPEKMLETVTVDAAKAIGMSEEVGSLEIGKRADIVLVDTFHPHLTPFLAPIWQLVHSSLGTDVSDVFVDGEAVVSGGRVLRVAEDEAMHMAEDEARSMISRAGIQGVLANQAGFWGQTRVQLDKHPTEGA
jgi:5-methylthioadenosine/S-adenosylhomocysteine deaminase